MSSTEGEKVHPIVIALMVIAGMIYFCGLYFHVKIIQVSRKDKDLTWKLDITNSVMILFHFFQSLFVHTITYIIKDLHMYLGEWFCYLFKVINTYTNFYVFGHALIISLTKHTIIVHWQKARDWGDEKITMLYFWINIIHPVISILIWLCIRPDFFWAWDGMAQIDRCLGDPKDIWVDSFEKVMENKSLTKLHILCQMNIPPQQDYAESIIHIFRTCSCWLHVGYYYGVVTNFLEMIVYFHIFAFMHRQVRNPPRSDNPLANRIEEDDIPLKKIRVNAQVTFVISILEMICSFISIIVVVIFKTATFPVIISIMITYLILLPTAFLMNTSNNKRRVIEHGWRNVLRNTFGLSSLPSNPDCNQRKDMNKNKTSSRRRNAVCPYKQGQVHSQMISHHLNKALPAVSTSTSVVARAEEVSDCKNRNKKKPLEIMMIPEKLERVYQTRRLRVKSIGDVGNIEFKCKTNRVRKASCSKNGKILLYDLEQESGVLFSCK